MIITRFAPSPTGNLHIGSVRTILYNWLYARRFGGKFLLRIEDTDQERSKLEYVDNIFNSMKWFGLDWDDEPVFQHKNFARHKEIAEMLLQSGKAYKCYCTMEELETERARAIAARQTPKYMRKCRDGAPQDKPYTVRLKAPMTGKTEFIDLIQGHCCVENEHMDDMVLLRSDGVPTYMLAVVVDDHDMHITHVIRGTEHLNNAYRQKHIYDACGWEAPQFAHVALIHDESGAKMSKRFGAVNVDEYRQQGFLPEAMLNYLLRLGFSKGEEIISIEECLKIFDVKDVGRSASRFSQSKLCSMNAVYMRAMDNQKLLSLLQDFIGKEKYDSVGWARVLAGMDELKSRVRTLAELAEMAEFYGNGADYFGQISEEIGKNFVRELITQVPNDLSDVKNWLDQQLLAKSLTLKEIAPYLRVALTKRPVAPSIFELMQILGPEIVRARLTGSITG